MPDLVVRKLFGKIHAFIGAALTMAFLFSSKVYAYSPENYEEVKNKLEKILASGEIAEKNKTKSLLEKLQDKFWDFLQSIWEKLNVGAKLKGVFSNAEISSGALLALKITAIILMIAVIVLVIYFIVRIFKRSRKVMQEEDALLLDILKDFDEVYQKAVEYYNNGDYTQGMRFLYISLLIRFNELNIIRINKAKTNKQYLLEIKDNKPQIYEAMAQFTQAFNRHWYGRKNTDKATFVSWSDVYNTLMTEVRNNFIPNKADEKV